MKLENAAVNVGAGIAGVAKSFVVLAFCLGVMGAGSASALDGIDLDDSVKAAKAGECPALIKIKYPFLPCNGGHIGTAEGDATWTNSRQIPTQAGFIEGHGFWGPEHNQGPGADEPLPYQGD